MRKFIACVLTFSALMVSAAFADEPAASTPTEQYLLKFKAVEVNVSLMHKLGVDFELVEPKEPVAENDVPSDASKAAQRFFAFTQNPNPRGYYGSGPLVPAPSAAKITVKQATAAEPRRGNARADFLDLLIRNSAAKVAAEPQIATTADRPVKLLAGGEIKVPIGRDRNEVTYKTLSYGTQFDGEVSRKSDSEVQITGLFTQAELDYSNAVTFEGKKIPGRRSRAIQVNNIVKLDSSAVVGGVKQTRYSTDSETNADRADEIRTYLIVSAERIDLR